MLNIPHSQTISIKHQIECIIHFDNLLKLEVVIPTIQLTVCTKPVGKTVGEHGSTATRETKPIILYFLKIHSVLCLTQSCTNEDASILPSQKTGIDTLTQKLIHINKYCQLLSHYQSVAYREGGLGGSNLPPRNSKDGPNSEIRGK
jgi:hypothetical protein